MREEVSKFRMTTKLEANKAQRKQLGKEDEKSHVPLLTEVCFTYASF